ncbi:single-stranded-DNA-specific exonuclease RecJ [Patescibacteria group bacterium]|nr:single-stranded-DNA-specific exonuclease RecJ [Patescibacteria group bacterium]MBU1916275.1 single-stranded-DNA-specific exonuclease RecJ [Patescibacteria group bacterium]
MDKRWQLAEPINDAWRDKFPELHPITVQLLKNRGIETQQQVDEFLLPDYGENLHDPFLFREMELVCRRIWSAIEDGERLTVFGDYDADGVCGTAILLTTFRQVADLCGSDPELINSYIPHREYEGYGLNNEAVRSIADSGSRLIITVDCGISNATEVDLVHQLGLDIIVTDHHQVPEHVPNCLIIHPLVPGENYPHDCLAGAGVAFKLAAAFLDYARQQGLEIPVGQEKWLLDLVAIATVTDFMKLVGENRTLEKWGLVVLNKTRRPGLRKLIEAAGLELGKLDTVSVGYYLGPRINAASRMEHADLALETLLIKDETQAMDLARKLNLCNAERQRVTEEIYRQAAKMFVPDKKVQVIVGTGWSAGVVGIVAGKLVTDWGVPVFVLSEQEDGRIVGSGRGIREFDLVDLLRTSANFLARYGGHPEACGLTIEKQENLDGFIAQAWQYAEEKLADRDLRPMLQLDAELLTDQITWDLINELERFEPFGVGNPKPLFLIKNAQLISFQPVGKDGKHVRVSTRGVGPRELKLIGFGFAERVAAFIPGDEIDVVVELGVNEWNGTKNIQVRMVDLRRSLEKKDKLESKVVQAAAND